MNVPPRKAVVPAPPAGSLGDLLPSAMPPDAPPRARPTRAGTFGVLDLGSTKVTCLIGRVEGDSVRVLGHGHHQSRGVRAGGITDLDEAEYAVRRAVGMAEDMADQRLRAVVVNLTCGTPASRLFDVEWPVGRAVTEADVRRVVAEGRALAAAEGRDTIHVLPLSFEVDDTPGVADPRGLVCDTLRARLHVVDAGASALRNLALTLERCELHLEELVSAPMAAGLSTLVDDERQLGVTLVDMGGGGTGMAVWSEGQVLHTAHLPVGGGHVTNDIARGLSTPVAHAEYLKTLYGNAQASPDDEREMLPVPMVGEDEHHIARVPRSQVVRIVKPRLEETFEMVRDRLAKTGLAREAGNRVVLTGGASQLVGVRELAERILDRRVRLGRPLPMKGLPDRHAGPDAATAAGLLVWASGQGRRLADVDLGDDNPPGLLRRIATFIRERV